MSKSDDLKVKLDNYFSDPRIQDVFRIFDDLEVEYKVLGGAVRDTYLEHTPKDIDICFLGTLEKKARLENEIDKLTKTKGNEDSYWTFGKMNNLKFVYKNLEFDVWNYTDSWVFRTHSIPFSNLHMTTLGSCNMITYAPATKSLTYCENYFKLLDEKTVLAYPENQPETFNWRWRHNYLLNKIGAVSAARACVTSLSKALDYTQPHVVSENFILSFLNTEQKKLIQFSPDGRIRFQ